MTQCAKNCNGRCLPTLLVFLINPQLSKKASSNIWRWSSRELKHDVSESLLSLIASTSACCFQKRLQHSISVCFCLSNFSFSFRWSRILTLLTSSQSAAEFEESEDLLDDSYVDEVWMESWFGSKTGLAAAGLRTNLATLSIGASLN